MFPGSYRSHSFCAPCWPDEEEEGVCLPTPFPPSPETGWFNHVSFNLKDFLYQKLQNVICVPIPVSCGVQSYR